MNLRSLKKKSKQAAILLRHYDLGSRKQFLAERGVNYHSMKIRCGHKPGRFGCKQGCEYHPLKGTPMIGWTSGYYEPEWMETTAYEQLRELVEWEARPVTMTDEEWRLALRITHAVPLTEEDLREMFGAAA